MPRRAVLVCALAVVGCDDAIDVRLVPPIGEVARPVDYGCVNRVLSVAYGSVADDPESSCVEIAPGTIDTLRDHNLEGLLDLALPSGFFALDIAGLRADGPGCAGADTVFHGEAFYDGGWSLDVPMLHGLDCDDFTTVPSRFRLLELTKVLAGGADVCAPPADAVLYQIEFAHHFPYDEGPINGTVTDAPRGPVSTAADGTGQLTGPHFAGAAPPSCLAVETAVVPPSAVQAKTCLDSTQEEFLCAPAADVELLLPNQADFATFLQIRNQNGPIAIGLVWDSATRRPLAGATVTPTEGSTTDGLGYFDFVGGAVVRTAGNATPAGGLFAIELSAPTVVDIAAPGKSPRRVVLPDGINMPGVLSIPM
ncbi:MAG: hypothetical protein KBG48_22015 [Kofleriaceae bacterium]|nr:hypothetical protein [Kofleriaceae bacterium]MBP9170098.1 hypothetical protein [Kofleriaceae bacterium]MBP9859948.1 hypothetical protein [Kofleriaceae bacterium]